MNFSVTVRAVALMLPASLGAAPVDFGRDVLPILSDACFRCHGPDEKARKAKLRLDQKEGAFRTVDGVTVVAPGKPESSELVTRITSSAADEVMPPPKANRKLTPAEIALLRRWVQEGAPWGRNWAFEPMQKDAPPESGGAWARREIDHFVAQRLDAEKLAPAPEADRERLLRRVTFDLTGLPPTLAEIDTFLSDHSADAFEKVVNRLLASPRFGERLASEWLDLARFADTHGYQMDRPRDMSPYRDWVIGAFNAGMPFDQFVTWQLAGDLLPGATKEQRLATAFNRLHCQNEEGGIVGEEFRVNYVNDRVTTFGTAFLGLTLECARCHDHKYDPISQRDFYSLAAFFQNIDEAGQIPFKGFADVMPVPTLLLSTPEQDARLAELRAKISAAEKHLAAARKLAKDDFDAWLEKLPEGLSALTPEGEVGRFAFDRINVKQVDNEADHSKPAHPHEQPKLGPGKHGQAVELDGENGFTFPGLGRFTRADSFSFALWLQAPADGDGKFPERSVVFHLSKAPVDAGSRGYELLLEDGRVAFGLHHTWPENSLKVVTKSGVVPNAWTHVAVTYDGSSRARGVRIFLDGKPAEVEVVRDGLWKDITYGGAEPEVALGFRFRDVGFKGGRVDDFRIFNRALTTFEVAATAERDDFSSALQAIAQLTPAQRAALFELYTATVHQPALDATKALHSARDELRKFIEPIPEIMVMSELPQPRPAFILKRGQYDQHGDAVSTATPGALPPFPADAPRNRLGLARWLLSPEHPLMARVTVNRFWQMMFGRGLVETSDNFGSTGATPTHPELLDWLARDFIASGWNVKALLRQIALSATYRQSSKTPPELLARDPQNLLLARGPARRLTAEMLRDQALAGSGLLVEKIGGASVKPYQPPGLWAEIAMGKPRYDQGHGDDLHRRSLYTFWKRTVPHPVMMTFDAADRSNCTARRQSTSTPLQALALLNDVQTVEAARFIGQRMLREGGAALDERLRFAFRLVTSREPRPRELEVLTRLFNEQLATFAQDAAASAQLVAFGETKSDASLPPDQLAAATVLAKALLNHDEALMRR